MKKRVTANLFICFCLLLVIFTGCSSSISDNSINTSFKIGVLLFLTGQKNAQAEKILIWYSSIVDWWLNRQYCKILLE